MIWSDFSGEDAYVLGEPFKSGEDLSTLATRYQARREPRSKWVKETSDTRIVAIGHEQAAARNAAIREKGAPNVTGFRVLMKENP